MAYVLDACAIIAYLAAESGADKVEEVIHSGEEVFVSLVNVLEVCYDSIKTQKNQDAAKHVLEQILSWPVHLIYDLKFDVLLKAAELKATYKISLADSVALGVSIQKNMKLVTSDHHEFDALEKNGTAQFLWIR